MIPGRALALPALAFALATPALAQASRPQPMPEFLMKVKMAALRAAGERKIRLGVATFQPTEAQRTADRGFGSYATEQIFAGLGSAGPGIRLFERARLDAVLKEQKLSASGLFDESEARKIGELAPIDLLLTGTYTRLEGSVVLHGRFLDVVSGEVVVGFSESLELTKDLAGLFGPMVAAPVERQATQGPRTGTEPDPCEATWAPLRERMKDLRTQDQVDQLVKAAIAVPFFEPCGAIHLQVMGQLLGHKLGSERYARFLVAQLPAIKDPDEDRRSGAIVTFLKSGGRLDDAAWKAVAEMGARGRHIRGYLDELLFEPELTPDALARLQKRSAVLMEMTEAGRIGRPVALAPGRMVLDLFGALQGDHMSSYRKGGVDPRPAMAFYRAHGTRVAPEREKDMMEALMRLLRPLGPGPERDEVLVWLGQRIAAAEPGREVSDVLNSFLQPLFRERARQEKEGRSAAGVIGDLRRFARAAGPKLAASLATFPDRETRIDLTRLCLAEGIEGPGLPTLEALKEQLAGDKVHERREAVRLLEAFGPRAAVVEPQLLRQLRRSNDGQEKYLAADMLDLLGHLQTRNPEAQRLALGHLFSLENVLSDAAGRALGRMGTPSLPLLKEAYPSKRPYEQTRIARVIRAMGPAAKAEIPWLKAQMKHAETGQLRDALEDAVEALEGATQARK